MKETGEKRYTNCTTAGPTFVTVKDGKMILYYTEVTLTVFLGSVVARKSVSS